MVQATVAAHISTICASALRHYDDITVAPDAAPAADSNRNASDKAFRATSPGSTNSISGRLGQADVVRACADLDGGSGGVVGVGVSGVEVGGVDGGGRGGGGRTGGGVSCGGGGGGGGGGAARTAPMGMPPNNPQSRDTAQRRGQSSERQPHLGHAEEEEEEKEENGDLHWWSDEDEIDKENDLAEAIESDTRAPGRGWMRRRRREAPFLQLLVRSQVGFSSRVYGIAGPGLLQSSQSVHQ